MLLVQTPMAHWLVAEQQPATAVNTHCRLFRPFVVPGLPSAHTSHEFVAGLHRASFAQSASERHPTQMPATVAVRDVHMPVAHTTSGLQQLARPALMQVPAMDTESLVHAFPSLHEAHE